MQLIIVLLSVILVLNALFLALLILIQLPKKEAGAGLAFGAGATDALFGAGSGNALTKMTKYAATVFLCLVLTLSFFTKQSVDEGSRRLQSELDKRAKAPAPLPSPAAALLNPTNPASNNIQLEVKTLTNTVGAATNAVAAPAPTTPAPKAP